MNRRSDIPGNFHPTLVLSVYLSCLAQLLYLVLSRLDYGSTVLFDLPQQLADKLHLFSTPLHDWWMLCCDCCPSSRPYLAHQPIAAGSSLAAGCWPYHISVGGTHLPLPSHSQFGAGVPVEIDNCSEFEIMFTYTVTDFVLRRPLFWLFREPVEPPLAVEVSLLLRCDLSLCRCSESHRFVNGSQTFRSYCTTDRDCSPGHVTGCKNSIEKWCLSRLTRDAGDIHGVTRHDVYDHAEGEFSTTNSHQQQPGAAHIVNCFDILTCTISAACRAKRLIQELVRRTKLVGF